MPSMHDPIAVHHYSDFIDKILSLDKVTQSEIVFVSALNILSYFFPPKRHKSQIRST